jgi:hypothetical protein
VKLKQVLCPAPRNEDVVTIALGCSHCYTSVEYSRADIVVTSVVNKNNVIASVENFTVV